MQRLEAELAKQEKRYQTLQDEKNKATETIEQLMKTQNSLKEKEKRQGERMKELERDIEAKNKLVCSVGWWDCYITRYQLLSTVVISHYLSKTVMNTLLSTAIISYLK